MLAPLIPIFYIVLSVILPAPLRWRWRAVLAFFVVLGASKLPLSKLLGVPWYLSPDNVPRPLLLLSSGAYILTIVFTLVLLCGDIVSLLPLAYLRWRRQLNVRLWRLRLHAALFVVACLLTVTGMVNALGEPHVHELTLAVPNLPPKQQGLTIALLADLHADPLFPEGHIQRMVDITNELKPDFILIAGDFVDGTPAQRQHLLAPLAELKPRFATLGVAGNHEYYSDYAAWKPVLAKMNVDMLDNAHRLFPEQNLAIMGVSDPNAVRYGFPAPDPQLASSGIPAEMVRLAMAHQPRLTRRFLELPLAQRPHLLMAGHTHGGMFPGFATFISLFNDGFVADLYQLEDMMLYVSRGTGIWNGFPIRLFCPPEIVRFTLTAKN